MDSRQGEAEREVKSKRVEVEELKAKEREIEEEKLMNERKQQLRL